jgi:diguanylate cyclase (GGDEF)-like protein
MAWQPDDVLGAQLNGLVDRRRKTFRQQVPEHLRAIELKHSARGTSFTAQIVDEVRTAIHEAFVEFSVGTTSDLLGAVKRQDGTVSNETATWIRQELERVLISSLEGVIDELQEGPAYRGKIKAALHEDAETMIADARRRLAVAIARVTERRRAAGPRGAVAANLGSADDLVKLKNRRGFTADFARLFSEASAAEPLAVVRIDIDHFKRVNDEHGGHAVGDEALIAIAGFLHTCVRGKGEAYRVGGDEFVLLLPNHTTSEATAVAERVRVTVNSRSVTSRLLTLSVSVGIATYPEHALDAVTLEQAADKASYDAKNRGRNLVRVFGEPDQTVTSRTRVVERKVPEAGSLTPAQTERR